MKNKQSFDILLFPATFNNVPPPKLTPFPKTVVASETKASVGTIYIFFFESNCNMDISYIYIYLVMDKKLYTYQCIHWVPY